MTDATASRAPRATVLIAQVVVCVVQAAVGIVAFFAMMALGGAFGPAEALPGPLATIGEHTPFGAAIEGMVAGWHGGSPQTSHLVALAGTTAAAGSVAAATFRWE